MAHSWFTYLRLKIIVSIVRFVISLLPVAKGKPSSTYQFQSRDAKRTITVHVYRPSAATSPSPVVLNWHGSGFVFPWHGSDGLYCERLASSTPYTVLDASYALAPEYPFPAALEDVEDLILQVLHKPQEYDAKKIVLSGFSAGANFALVASSNRKSQIPRDAIAGVIAFYPPCDISIPPASKRAPEGAKGLPAFLARTFNASYMPPGTDAKDARISLLYAEAGNFPANVLIVTAGQDNLALEAEELAEKLKVKGRNVVTKRVGGVEHAWDKSAKAGSVEARERDGAYDLAIDFLKKL